MKPRQVRSAAAQGRVLIKSSPALGTIAIANRSFDEGEVVLDEPPFLVIAKRDLSSFRRDGEDGHTTTGDATEVSFAALAVTKGLPAGFFDALEAALSTLSTNEFKLLVEELYSPLAHQPGDSDAWLSDVLRPTVTEMEACQALFLRVDENKATRDHKTLELLKDVFWPKTRTTSDVERAAFAVLRFLHGVRVNTHSDDKAGYSAVFIAASKFTHDCSPNTFWYLQRDESADGSAANLRASVRAVHVATRKINEGDMLTFSYVGTGWNMLTHTMERRLMLRPLNFTCGCSRCSKFDEGGETCRNLHCPACLTQMTREPGAQLFLSKAATMALQPGGGWKCTKCGVTPSSDDMNDVLGSERAMVERVLGAFFRAPPPSGGKPLSLTSPLELKAKMGIVRRVAESYGQTHYVWVAAVCGLCRALCLFLPHVHENPAVVSSATASRDPVGSMSFVISAIVGAVVWFEKNMKGSPQHVRFMTHVCQVRSSFKNYMESPLQLFDDEGDAAAAVALDRVAAKFESTVAKFAAYPDYAAVR